MQALLLIIHRMLLNLLKIHFSVADSAGVLINSLDREIDIVIASVNEAQDTKSMLLKMMKQSIQRLRISMIN